ncbi:MAG: fluoride efflux transporter CrcB [Phenylobacterium sp.]|uniref:fluoride efflux transporter CrcB n=1 Tax=Phenylobacterium sp. TaxID=1871053 RepID=UPI0027377AA0|nr:fluoride efflux transporter CrcB [Phenylobacterium sp.]MDP3175654.1 fluoride efflux transporter CrcB [Phenylobacterium sp.]
MGNLLLVGFGGAAGAIARYGVGVQALRWLGPAWPYGTLAVNVIGGLLMGALVGYLAQRGGADQERLRLLLGVGVLGGFTTFSAYSLEVALMLERREYGPAAIYALVSTAAAVAALFAGMILARRLFA